MTDVPPTPPPNPPPTAPSADPDNAAPHPDGLLGVLALVLGVLALLFGVIPAAVAAWGSGIVAIVLAVVAVVRGSGPKWMSFVGIGLAVSGWISGIILGT